VQTKFINDIWVVEGTENVLKLGFGYVKRFG
jgi:hypothetical protein